MIFKRDLAANGVTQLEAMFNSIISTSVQLQAAHPYPGEKMEGALRDLGWNRTFQANFLFCPNKASCGKTASLVCEWTSGLLGLSVTWGADCSGWGCGELQRRGPHNSLLVTCLMYVRSPVSVSLDLIYSFPMTELPFKPSVFSPLSVEVPPVILGRVLNQLQNFSNSGENFFYPLRFECLRNINLVWVLLRTGQDPDSEKGLGRLRLDGSLVTRVTQLYCDRSVTAVSFAIPICSSILSPRTDCRCSMNISSQGRRPGPEKCQLLWIRLGLHASLLLYYVPQYLRGGHHP